jgi:hypothetical protein
VITAQDKLIDLGIPFITPENDADDKHVLIKYGFFERLKAFFDRLTGQCRRKNPKRRAKARHKAPALGTSANPLITPACRAAPSVILDLRRPETRHSMPFDLALPVQEFVDRQAVALAGVIKAQKSTAHRGDDLRFSPDHPATGVRWGKIGIVSGPPSGPTT